MLPKHLRAHAFEMLQKTTVAFITMFTITMSLLYYNLASNSNANAKKQEIDNLQQTLDEIKNKAAKSEASLELWKSKMQAKHSDRTGLKIKPLKGILDELKKTNEITNFNINISNPEIRPDFKDAKFAAIAYSNISSTFNAYTDVDATRFLYRITQEIPGYAQIKSLNMSAIHNIDDTVLANIASGSLSNIIDVKVEMLWQDIVDKNTSIQASKAKQDERPRQNQQNGSHAATPK